MSANGAEAPAPAPASVQSGLYDRPVLAVDPGMHTAMIRWASADAAGALAVTCAEDRTLRVWSSADGKLLRSIRMPAGPDGIGTPFTVALSPDGKLIAAGGRTQPAEPAYAEIIYLFDAATGAMAGRITGLPGLVGFLAFSPDGGLLVAGLSQGGIRIFAPQAQTRSWAEVGQDTGYRLRVSGGAFAADGRLAVTSYDETVALYAADLRGPIKPVAVLPTPGRRPFDLAFSPDGARIAVGYDALLAVDLLDGRSLAAAATAPDLTGIAGGDLSSVVWSRDGETLYAAGMHPPALTETSAARKRVVAWDKQGTAPPRSFEAAQTTITRLLALPGGDLVVVAGDPWIGRLDRTGVIGWQQKRPQADLRGQSDTFGVSADGMIVDFGFEVFGRSPARFDVQAQTLSSGPPADGRTAQPFRSDLPFAGWFNTGDPRLGDWHLPMQRGEYARSLALHPAGNRFVLGADWTIAAFDVAGHTLWRQAVPGTVWAVNVTGNGRLVVAGFGDGSIRWLRMADGVELLAVMPLANRSGWVAWTPEGFFASSEAAFGILRWYVNRGADAAPDSLAISDIPGSFRPKLLPLVLRELDIVRALGMVELGQQNRAIRTSTNSRIPPGARLHVLAIGVNLYKNTTLKYAAQDARALATLINGTQRALYADLLIQAPTDADADRSGVINAFEAVWQNIRKGGGNDQVVVHLSGHGAVVDDKLYFLLSGVDTSSAVSIKNFGYRADDFRDELARLADYGRVLVLLDACHSGLAADDGQGLTVMDSRRLREGLAAQNITVLTSCTGPEVSYENDAWQHGAFTKVLLDAFDDPAADPDNVGLIATNGLAHYVSSRVPALTEGAQTPGMAVRYDAAVFARRM